MKIGCIGDIPFEVNHDAVFTPSNFSWAGSVRVEEHQRHGMNALTEFTGIDADRLSFEIYLSKTLGVDPMEMLTKLWKYEREGTPLSLVLGNHAYGKYKWLITDHTTTGQFFTPDGDMLTATVSINLIEYLKQ